MSDKLSLRLRILLSVLLERHPFSITETVSCESCTPWPPEATFLLSFKAHLSQTLSFRWCKMKIKLDAKCM